MQYMELLVSLISSWKKIAVFSKLNLYSDGIYIYIYIYIYVIYIYVYIKNHWNSITFRKETSSLIYILARLRDEICVKGKRQEKTLCSP